MRTGERNSIYLPAMGKRHGADDGAIPIAACYASGLSSFAGSGVFHSGRIVRQRGGTTTVHSGVVQCSAVQSSGRHLTVAYSCNIV